MARYDPLRRHLESQIKPEIVFDFNEMELILGFTLPRSASVHRAWWANEQSSDTSHTHCRAWLDALYDVGMINAEQGRVVFKRARG